MSFVFVVKGRSLSTSSSVLVSQYKEYRPIICPFKGLDDVGED